MDVPARLTNAAVTDGEIVRSRSPDAGIKSRVTTTGGDGGSKPGHTEEITYKP